MSALSKKVTDAATRPMEFIDLAAQQARIRPQIEAAIRRVLDHGNYIMGPEVTALEKDLAAFSDVAHAISCSSGTDALLMIMMAKGVGPGDAIICPSFTFTATPEVIALLGATPVMCDVDEKTFNVDPAKLSDALDTARTSGLKPKGIIAVDLFGQPADYDAITQVAQSNDIWVLADAAQSFGGSYKGRNVGSLSFATATSFFPAKPLGCYGDGGAVLTDDDELADALVSIRVHGKGSDKYDNIRIGLNARLDTIQAAILIEKLKIFPSEIEARARIAKRYVEALSGLDGLILPKELKGVSCVWAQYTMRVDPQKRANIAEHMKSAGLPTAVYYPKPIHLQSAYSAFPVSKNGLPVSERLSTEVLSLPMHPYLNDTDQDSIIQGLTRALNA